MTEHYLHGVEVLEIDDGARVIQTASSSVIGLVGTAPLADATTYPLNTPVLIPGSTAMAATLGTAGTLPQAMDSIFDQIGAAVIVVRIEDSVDETQRLSHAVGGINAANGTYEGVHALLAAENITGYKPRLLIAPGLTHQRPEQTQANPVVSELIGIAERLRAIIIADGPGTTDAQAIAYAGDFGSKRVFLVDPRITTLGADGTTITAYSSAAVAGLIAKIDNRNGWWWSPSNQPINGILGTSRPIDFALGDATSRANLLNEKRLPPSFAMTATDYGETAPYPAILSGPTSAWSASPISSPIAYKRPTCGRWIAPLPKHTPVMLRKASMPICDD